jgi:hypothetical protein
MNLVVGKNVDEEKWNQLLNCSDNASVFQSPEYVHLVEATPGQYSEVFALQLEGEYKSLVVVTLYHSGGIKGALSKRGIVYGAPLFQDKEHWEVLLPQVIQRLKAKCIYVEFRHYFDMSNVFTSFEQCGFAFLPYLNFELHFHLKKMEQIISAMKYNRKREIRLSYENGAISREAKSIAEVETLYGILKELYDNRVKLPLPGFDFFRQMFEHVACGKVIVVVHEDRVIGGAFNLFRKNAGLYSMYYCGIRDYHKKIFPTHLAIMGSIEWGMENGCRWMDFMGAGKKGEEYGVRKYKEEFGGDLTEYGRHLLVLQPLKYQLGKWGLKVLAKLK